MKLIMIQTHCVKYINKTIHRETVIFFQNATFAIS